MTCDAQSLPHLATITCPEHSVEINRNLQWPASVGPCTAGLTLFPQTNCTGHLWV